MSYNFWYHLERFALSPYNQSNKTLKSQNFFSGKKTKGMKNNPENLLKQIIPDFFPRWKTEINLTKVAEG